MATSTFISSSLVSSNVYLWDKYGSNAYLNGGIALTRKAAADANGRFCWSSGTLSRFTNTATPKLYDPIYATAAATDQTVVTSVTSVGATGIYAGGSGLLLAPTTRLGCVEMNTAGGISRTGDTLSWGPDTSLSGWLDSRYVPLSKTSTGTPTPMTYELTSTMYGNMFSPNASAEVGSVGISTGYGTLLLNSYTVVDTIRAQVPAGALTIPSEAAASVALANKQGALTILGDTLMLDSSNNLSMRVATGVATTSSAYWEYKVPTELAVRNAINVASGNCINYADDLYDTIINSHYATEIWVAENFARKGEGGDTPVSGSYGVATYNSEGMVRPVLDGGLIITDAAHADLAVASANASTFGGMRIGSNFYTTVRTLNNIVYSHCLTLSAATADILGGVKVPSGSGLSIAADGTLKLSVASTYVNYTGASAGTYGGVKVVGTLANTTVTEYLSSGYVPSVQAVYNWTTANFLSNSLAFSSGLTKYTTTVSGVTYATSVTLDPATTVTRGGVTIKANAGLEITGGTLAAKAAEVQLAYKGSAIQSESAEVGWHINSAAMGAVVVTSKVESPIDEAVGTLAVVPTMNAVFESEIFQYKTCFNDAALWDVLIFNGCVMDPAASEANNRILCWLWQDSSGTGTINQVIYDHFQYPHTGTGTQADPYVTQYPSIELYLKVEQVNNVWQVTVVPHYNKGTIGATTRLFPLATLYTDSAVSPTGKIGIVQWQHGPLVLGTQDDLLTFDSGLTSSNHVVTLDKATSQTIGGVYIGAGIDVNSGTISVAASASAKPVSSGSGISVTDSGGSYTVALNNAGTDSIGGVQIPLNSGLSLNTTDGTLKLSSATATSIGGVIVPASKGLGINNGSITLASASKYTTYNGAAEQAISGNLGGVVVMTQIASATTANESAASVVPTVNAVFNAISATGAKPISQGAGITVTDSGGSNTISLNSASSSIVDSTVTPLFGGVLVPKYSGLVLQDGAISVDSTLINAFQMYHHAETLDDTRAQIICSNFAVVDSSGELIYYRPTPFSTWVSKGATITKYATVSRLADVAVSGGVSKTAGYYGWSSGTVSVFTFGGTPAVNDPIFSSYNGNSSGWIIGRVLAAPAGGSMTVARWNTNLRDSGIASNMSSMSVPVAEIREDVTGSVIIHQLQKGPVISGAQGGGGKPVSAGWGITVNDSGGSYTVIANSSSLDSRYAQIDTVESTYEKKYKGDFAVTGGTANAAISVAGGAVYIDGNTTARTIDTVTCAVSVPGGADSVTLWLNIPKEGTTATAAVTPTMDANNYSVPLAYVEADYVCQYQHGPVVIRGRWA